VDILSGIMGTYLINNDTPVPKKKATKKTAKKAGKDTKNESFKPRLNQETVEAIIAIVFIVTAVFLCFAAFGNAGTVGKFSFAVLFKLFGVGYYFIPVILIGLGISFLATLKENPALRKIATGIIIFLSIIGLIELSFESKGGLVGGLVASPLQAMFGIWVAGIILFAILLIALIIEFNLSLKFDWKKLFERKEKEVNDKDIEDAVSGIVASANSEDDEDEKTTTTKSVIAEKPEQKDKEPIIRTTEEPKQAQSEKPSGLIFFSKKANQKFTPPPLSLLQKDSGKPGVGDIKANANIIKRTLINFGINVEMDEISIGPSVTRYALKPAEGVKLSKIVALQNDLALALAAHPLRIEAPIPGKSLVGIEIPNKTKTTVGLGTLLKDPAFNDPKKPLNVCMGKGITGISHFANLAKMPHGLIAGATGSGKSVTIHALITSLLYRNHPDQLKFIMVDPKRVELTLYNEIPHLLTPVITEPKKAILALKWAVNEMSRRYDVLEKHKVRDIGSYHENILKPALREAEKSGDEETEVPESMPYIVVFIDELADLMQAYPRELESNIVRLAQMSRAIGIHLILSTQRPSVNVVTGLIKANVPTRVALQVASAVDSKTILDMTGAEKLLGAGDMLYLSSDKSQPVRIQSAYITEEETKDIVDWIKNHYANEVPNEASIDFTGKGSENDLSSIEKAGGFGGFDDEEEDDELYGAAKETVIEAGKASTSYIQRKLRVGYARAARLMDILEERGVIGPADGSKPREILDAGEDGPREVAGVDNMIVEEDGSMMGNPVEREEVEDEEQR